jgi:lipoyl-dependent peroxiredoxin
MSTTRHASAQWEGTLFEGAGQVTMNSSGLGTFDISWPSRAEEPQGRTSPEELIAAAHASCFSMALANGLAKQGNTATRLDTRAEVDFVPGTGITQIRLFVTGSVPNVDAAAFAQAADDAKHGCPVSQALSAVPITVQAQLT